MTNVIDGPWTTPPVRKPFRKMTKVEKARFRAWQDWLVSLLVDLSRASRERLGRSLPETADETLLGSQFARSAAIGALKGTAHEWARQMPPVPIVWPENYSLDFARGAMAALGIESDAA